MNLLIQQIDHWIANGKDFKTGLMLMLAHGRPPAGVKRMLEKCQQPGSAQLSHLEHQIKLIREQAVIDDTLGRNGNFNALTPPNNPAIPLSAKKIEKPFRPGKKTPYRPPQPTKASPDLKRLTGDLRTAYTRRAMLSNQLTDPGDSEELRLANVAILKQLAPIMAQMKEIEAQIAQLRSGGSLPSQTPMVVKRKNEAYTMDELEQMDMEQLKKLKRRLTMDKSKARKKQTDPRVRKESTKAKAALEVVTRSNEITLVDRLIKKQIRQKQNEGKSN